MKTFWKNLWSELFLTTTFFDNNCFGENFSKENFFDDNILPPELRILRSTKGTLSKGTKMSKQVTNKNTSPKFDTFVEFFSQDPLKSQDILTQEQIKSLDVRFPDAGSGIDDIGLPLLLLVAIGIDFGAAVQYVEDEAAMENVLTEEQLKSGKKLYEEL